MYDFCVYLYIYIYIVFICECMCLSVEYLCVSAYVWYVGRISCGWITAQGERESSLDQKEQMHQGLNILSKC